MIKNFNQWNSLNESRSGSNWVLIYEALKPEQEKKYLELVRSTEAVAKMDSMMNKIAKLPGAERSDDGDRIYVPFFVEGELQESPVESEIKNVLGSAGYEVKDYKKGLAVDKNMQNREIKIGKVLSRMKREDLLRQFTSDKSRENVKLTRKEMMLVFSTNKVDIAAMSTGRGWTSCMNLDTGVNVRYVSCDVEEGTIICYLTSSDDKNVENPNSRILIKPYINLFPPNDVIYIPDPVYGTAPENFIIEVNRIMRKLQEGKKEDLYLMIQRLYQDQPTTDVRMGGAMKISDTGFEGTVTEITKSAISGRRKVTTKQEIEEILDELLIFNYNVDPNTLLVDVNGDVNLKGLGMEMIPFQFGVVRGDFDCSGNKMKSLKGSPRKTNGFFCISSGLETLEGSPEEVVLFDCSYNDLKSLKGCPSIATAFRCSNNSIVDFDVDIELRLKFECIDNKPELTREKLMKCPGISADEYKIGTSKNPIRLDRSYKDISYEEEMDNVDQDEYIENSPKNEKLMVKKFNQWVNESLHSGVPVDFFKKIHQYSKKRPLDIQADITDDLINNDLEDVSHHFYELGTNPPEQEK